MGAPRLQPTASGDAWQHSVAQEQSSESRRSAFSSAARPRSRPGPSRRREPGAKPGRAARRRARHGRDQRLGQGRGDRRQRRDTAASGGRRAPRARAGASGSGRVAGDRRQRRDGRGGREHPGHGRRRWDGTTDGGSTTGPEVSTPTGPVDYGGVGQQPLIPVVYTDRAGASHRHDGLSGGSDRGVDGVQGLLRRPAPPQPGGEGSVQVSKTASTRPGFSPTTSRTSPTTPPSRARRLASRTSGRANTSCPWT